MPLSLILALALQTAPDAAAAQPSSPAPAVAKTAELDTSDIPSSAPTDDYGFVAWCRGALSGHMQLYPSVKDELRKIEDEKAAKEDARYTTDAQREAAKKRRAKEVIADIKLDQEQMEAGQMYLKLYTEALEAAEAASAGNIHARGVAARDAGFRIWAAARGAEPRTRMWSWVMWELPARCETAAKRLRDRSLLLGGALKARAEPSADAPDAATAAPVIALDETPIELSAKVAKTRAKTKAAPAKSAKVVTESPAAAEPAVVEEKPSETPPIAADAAPKADAPAPETPALETPAPATPAPESAPSAPEPKAAEASPVAAPALRGGLSPPPLDADAPVSRRESHDAPAPAPEAPPEAPKP